MPAQLPSYRNHLLQHLLLLLRASQPQTRYSAPTGARGSYQSNSQTDRPPWCFAMEKNLRRGVGIIQLVVIMCSAKSNIPRATSLIFMTGAPGPSLQVKSQKPAVTVPCTQKVLQQGELRAAADRSNCHLKFIPKVVSRHTRMWNVVSLT